MSPSERKVVLASSLGTLFEWYDFFLYGALTAITSKHFFSARRRMCCSVLCPSMGVIP